jgi:hypothetical protein
MDQRQAAVVDVCCLPRTRVTIRDRRSFGREEEDEDDDSDGSHGRDDYEGTMTTTNDCSGWEAQHRRTMET